MSDNVNSNILYIGVELTADKVIRSKIQTSDIFIVFADLLLKMRKPYGIKPNRSKKIMFAKTKVYLSSTPKNCPTYVGIQASTSMIDTKMACTYYFIKTHITSSTIEDQVIKSNSLLNKKNGFSFKFGEITSPFYKGVSYDSSLRELAVKLESYTKGNIVAAKLLLPYAASNPEHPIWDMYYPGEKGLGVGYKGRWNLTNWSGM